jgi:hypothetical protein
MPRATTDVRPVLGVDAKNAVAVGLVNSATEGGAVTTSAVSRTRSTRFLHRGSFGGHGEVPCPQQARLGSDVGVTVTQVARGGPG